MPSEYLDVRPARKAGGANEPPDRGWYDGNRQRLNAQLDGFFSNVPTNVDGSSLPIAGARIIIGPHAGYSYSGSNAAWAYSCLDLSRAKRIFILGPSHRSDFQGCKTTQFRKWATPLGHLTVDQDLIQELQEKGRFSGLDPSNDIEEHSLELHAPYIYKRCEQTFGNPTEFPKIVPIVVGRAFSASQKEYGRFLAPYLKDPENAFVISSDFCHWGSWFSYLPYSLDKDIYQQRYLAQSGPKPTGVPIHEYIETIDMHALDAIESGSHDAFVDSIKLTRNTVCGQCPIGIAMAALEKFSTEVKESHFKVVKYDRSQLVTQPNENSVSYVSAYAVL